MNRQQSYFEKKKWNIVRIIELRQLLISYFADKHKNLQFIFLSALVERQYKAPIVPVF